MAFIKGSQIFTDSGWKLIEDISGKDKVLVRNFIGDAQFMQPFALKKRKYNGNMSKLGGLNWNITVTPDHEIVYQERLTVHKVKASDMQIKTKRRINRSFKYLVPEDYKPENVHIYDEFGERWVTVSNDDWFVLLGYTICRAMIEVFKHGRLALQISLNSDKRDEEIRLLSDILDRIGVRWSLIARENDKWLIRISAKSTLPARLKTRLRSTKRKQMYLSDKIIYSTSRPQAKVLIDTIINASKKAKTVVDDDYQFVTSNEKLIDSLVLLGTLSGYGMAKKLLIPAGTDTGIAVTKNNVFSLSIRQPVKSYSVTYNKTKQFTGDVYEIDLFDGEVYTRDKGQPVWVNPK